MLEMLFIHYMVAILKYINVPIVDSISSLIIGTLPCPQNVQIKLEII